VSSNFRNSNRHRESKWETALDTATQQRLDYLRAALRHPQGLYCYCDRQVLYRTGKHDDGCEWVLAVNEVYAIVESEK
jgi:hypothetical protein